MRQAAATAVLLAIFVGGVVAGRAWFPRVRVEQVDREVLQVLPGETRTIIREVPGPERRVEVPILIERPGPERVVTITMPVDVPVEVVRERWPQTLTVRVGSVMDTEGVWRTPRFQEFAIGQVSPGIYAVPAEQPGWRLEEIRTETRFVPPPPARFHIELRPALGVISIGPTVALAAGVQLQATRGHLSLELAGGQSTAGPWGMALISYRF